MEGFDWPPGFKFAPSDYEVILYYLIPKTQDQQQFQCDFISEMTVFTMEPQSLDWTQVPYLKHHERYYFVRRERLATKTGKCGSKRAKRTLESETGFWKLSTGKHKIKDHKGYIVGQSSSLNYFTYKDSTTKDRNQAIKSTRWIMTEYILPGDDFQEWAVCKIKDREREKQEEPFNYPQGPPHPLIAPQLAQDEPNRDEYGCHFFLRAT